MSDTKEFTLAQQREEARREPEFVNAVAEAIKNLGLKSPPRRPGKYVGSCPFCRGGSECEIQVDSLLLDSATGIGHCFACSADIKLSVRHRKEASKG